MAHSVKLVLGEQASILHTDGASDDVVQDFGSIETFTFNTEAELNAFLQGLETMEGWLGYCEYQEH